MNTVRRPYRVLVASGAVCQLNYISGCYVHDEDVVGTRLEPPGPGERNSLPVRVPGRIYSFALPGRQPHDVCAVCIHSIYLRGTGTPGNEHNIITGAGI